MPRLSLIKPQGDCPPNGFRYVDPLDGWVCHAWTYNDWVDLAKAHLVANQREIPNDLGLVMQDQLCQTLDPGWCNYDSDKRPRPTTSLGWGDVASGIATFTKWIASGAQYVAQSEADRRAEICSRCYLNVNVEGCGACHKAVAEITKEKKSKYDYSLKACGVCKCLLRAKIHFPLSVMEESTRKHQDTYRQVAHCWLNSDSENFRG